MEPHKARKWNDPDYRNVDAELEESGKMPQRGGFLWCDPIINLWKNFLYRVAHQLLVVYKLALLFEAWDVQACKQCPEVFARLASQVRTPAN